MDTPATSIAVAILSTTCIKLEVYFQPHLVIRRMTFADTMTALDNVRHSSNMSNEFFVEAVAY
jgi:hypothetical protein